jgi:hypothetical protein
MGLPQNNKKYKPHTVNAQSWQDIERNYVDLNNHGWQLDPLLQLVRHVIATRLSDRLFAFTSLDTLVVSIYDPIERDREALHIKFENQSQKWSFKYYPRPNDPVEFERTYIADEGMEKFDNFIKTIKW